MNIFIGLSWPYANGEFHIGHLGSSIPADIIARYYRLKGHDVCFVSGSDCYGTPISIQAQKENRKPSEIAEFYHEKFVDVLEKLQFSFDNYTKTTSENHISFAQNFHKNLYEGDYVYTKEEKRLFCEHCNRFLPDRYVEGTCPVCGSHSRGDACEKCGKILEPEDLLKPQCGLCSSTPIFKDNFQYCIALSKLENKLKNFFYENKANWSTNAINLTERYFSEGLLDRTISRDLDWGVAVPKDNLKDKVIYNWGENVLGYIAGCKEYCEKKNINFKEWFNCENSKHIYIHAKDNIQFHTIIYPALLLASKDCYHLPDEIFAYEFVTNEGQKISKSKGTNLSARELLENYDVDFLRFYFAKNISDKKDLDFRLKDLISVVNGELINNWGNFVNRTLSFIKNKFDGKISCCEIDFEIEIKIKNTFDNVEKLIKCGKVSNALREICELVDFSNKFFNETQPWNVLKTDKKGCEKLCYQYLTLIANLAILLNPFIPKGSEKVLFWLNVELKEYGFKKLNNTFITDFAPLYTRI